MIEQHTHHVHVIAATAVGVFGSAFAFVGTVLADAGGNDIAPWLQTGGIGITVTVLGYIAKAFIDGKLISHPIAEQMKELEKQRDEWKRTAEDAMGREEAFRTMLVSREVQRQRGRRDDSGD